MRGLDRLGSPGLAGRWTKKAPRGVRGVGFRDFRVLGRRAHESEKKVATAMVAQGRADSPDVRDGTESWLGNTGRQPLDRTLLYQAKRSRRSGTAPPRLNWPRYYWSRHPNYPGSRAILDRWWYRNFRQPSPPLQFSAMGQPRAMSLLIGMVGRVGNPQDASRAAAAQDANRSGRRARGRVGRYGFLFSKGIATMLEPCWSYRIIPRDVITCSP